MEDVVESLIRAFEEIIIIDAHEHLPPEKVRVEQRVDVFTLFSHYTYTDLLAAGMEKDLWDKIHNHEISLERRWSLFKPYLKMIRYCAYARPAFIAAREIYGFEDITDENYKAISEKISSENKPGIYRKILREKCKIRAALTQCNRTDYDLDLLVPLMPLDNYASIRFKEDLEKRAEEAGEDYKTIDDYLEIVRKGLKRWISEGVVGIKMTSRPYDEPDRSKAVALFDKVIRKDSVSLSIPNPLYVYIMDEMLKMASELNLVVAVHTGMWGDFRQLAPQHMIPIFSRHSRTRFDMYHLGVPYVREAMIIGKNFPNVWLNLCWCHIISPQIACSAIDELIDLVPINKIIAFGGDYHLPVEKVYGHLVMARENIAKVLGRRISDGLITENEALEIARMWFYDNPRELYGLNI